MSASVPQPDEAGARRPSVNASADRLPDAAGTRLAFDTKDNERLTHQLFRFPAKFHPPVVRRLLEDYTRPGDLVLDPFCGSGTLLVEASISGRSAIGFDVDPLSVFLSTTKSQHLSPVELEHASDALLVRCAALSRSRDEYKTRMHEDLDDAQMAADLGDLKVPAIPNLTHWFRRYVVVDLARLRAAIDDLGAPPNVHAALRLVFASIIRGASNADPVPVSGLERTRHMLDRDDAGRLIDPFALFRRKLRRAIEDFNEYEHRRDAGMTCCAVRADATEPLPMPRGSQARAAITSPPYHGAVDYYRRHQLEMFWLDLTLSQQDRLALLEDYLGRPHVPQRHRFVRNTTLTLWPAAASYEQKMARSSPRRADEFRHYCVGMSRAFRNLADVLPEGAPAVFVVGHSGWKGEELRTSELFSELAGPYFELDQQLWYPVKNRHMSYGRHNDANIDREYALILRRTAI